jgi:hypothetical protein
VRSRGVAERRVGLPSTLARTESTVVSGPLAPEPRLSSGSPPTSMKERQWQSSPSWRRSWPR